MKRCSLVACNIAKPAGFLKIFSPIPSLRCAFIENMVGCSFLSLFLSMQPRTNLTFRQADKTLEKLNTVGKTIEHEKESPPSNNRHCGRNWLWGMFSQRLGNVGWDREIIMFCTGFPCSKWHPMVWPVLWNQQMYFISGDFTLDINPVTLEDDATFQCQVSSSYLSL